MAKNDLHKMILALRAAMKDELSDRDGSTDALAEALSAFVQCDDVQHAPTLVKMLSDQHQLMHHAAMLGLLSIGPAALDELDRVLCDPDEEHVVVDRVAQVMYFMSTTWSFERIGEVLGYPRAWSLMGQWIDFGPQSHAQYEEDTGASVILTLREQIEDDALRIAQGLLSHEVNTALDYGILGVLAGFAPSKRALSLIQNVLARWVDAANGGAVIARGLWALTRWPAEDALPTLMHFLGSSHHTNASLALSQLGLSAIPSLIRTIELWRTDRTKTAHRADAVRALTRIEDSSATQALLHLFDDSDILIRHMTWYTLAAQGLAVELLIDKATYGDDLDQPEALEALSRCPHRDACLFLEAQREQVDKSNQPFEYYELTTLIARWKQAFDEKVH